MSASSPTDLPANIQSHTDIINERKTKIENEIMTQKRVNQFNDSARKRFQMYTEIIIYIVIALIVYLCLVFAAQTFTFIPSTLFDLASAITFVVVAVLSYKKYMEVQSRDKLNFDELDLAPMPAQPSSEDKIKMARTAAEAGALSDITKDCVGLSCCGDGTSWDSLKKACLPTPTPVLESVNKERSAFTTLEKAYLSELDNSSYEFVGRRVNIDSLGKGLPHLATYDKNDNYMRV